MLEIGEHPILWHLMKIYNYYGIDDFIICLGYKGHVVEQYFSECCVAKSDLIVGRTTGDTVRHSPAAETWKVTLVDTGPNTMTGGRLRRVRRFLDNEPFCFTYGDRVADIDIHALVRSHAAAGKLATLTAVQSPDRFGAFTLAEEMSDIRSVTEKPQGDGAWISGGVFVLEPEAIDYIEGDSDIWEHGPLSRLAADGQLQSYHHGGFWQPMDTLHDKTVLMRLWDSGQAPWKVWDRRSDQASAPLLRRVS